MKNITYKKAGVDIASASVFKKKLKPLVAKSFCPGAIKEFGGFGSFFAIPKGRYKDMVLVSSADGVGTKLKIAVLADMHTTVGIDAVAMNVNDILCTGAQPLFFLDYIAYSTLSEDTLLDIVGGINKGCIDAGCALIGGETAQMPGMYKEGEYDIAGFCVGALEKGRIIDGSKISPGDVVIGLASNGLHSNGYSLVRKVLSKKELKKMSKELLKPTRIYVKPILSLLSCQDCQSSAIKGIAHITGGAFYDKIARILPDNVATVVRKSSWPVPEIFKLIQTRGGVADKEMYHTLNMGIGMVLIVSSRYAVSIITALTKLRQKAWVIGEIVRGKKEVEVI